MARRRSKAQKPAKKKIVAKYDYVDEAGTLVLQAVRYEPRGFSQRQPDGKGGWINDAKGVPRLPYRLPELLEAIGKEQTIFVVEGEKDVDNLAEIGIVATCNVGGAKKWYAEHAAFLKGADIIIIPDNDVVGRDHADQVTQSLAGIAARVRRLELPDLPAKGDVSDWLAAGGDAAKLWALVEQAKASTDDAPASNEQPTEKKSRARGNRPQAETLVDLALGEDVELYRSPDGLLYADVMVDGHRETGHSTAWGWKRWLLRAYWEQKQNAPNSEAISTAQRQIEAQALFSGIERSVHLRVAEQEGRLYLDLCDHLWRAVEITADGWQVVDAPTVRFRRTQGMQNLPEPVRGGSIHELRDHLNLDDDSFILIVSWLMMALRGKGPYPVLGLTGEQGAAKSTTAKILRRLVDPHSTPLRAKPKSTKTSTSWRSTAMCW